MLWRFAARLLTGPLAFLLAGIVDLLAFAAATLAQAVARRRARTARPRRV